MTRNIAAPAAIRIQTLAFNISPHFIHRKTLRISPAQGQIVIPVFVFRDKALHGITCIQLPPHPAAGLMTSFIVIEAEQNGAELRRLFQHLQYRLNGCAATGYIAVPLPVLRIGSKPHRKALFCPHHKKPKTARTAGRSGSSRGTLSPALSPAFLSSDASLPTKRFKARPNPHVGHSLGLPVKSAHSGPQGRTRRLHLHLRGLRFTIPKLLGVLVQAHTGLLLAERLHLAE